MATPRTRTWMTTKELAAHLRVAAQTLNLGRMGVGGFRDCPFVRVGRAIRYELAAVESWMDGHWVVPVSSGDDYRGCRR